MNTEPSQQNPIDNSTVVGILRLMGNATQALFVTYSIILKISVDAEHFNIDVFPIYRCLEIIIDTSLECHWKHFRLGGYFQHMHRLMDEFLTCTFMETFSAFPNQQHTRSTCVGRQPLRERHFSFNAIEPTFDCS